MWRSVAVLSDIHGVLPALRAVLAEPEVAAADRIVVTGDVACGPQPFETMETLRALGERVIWVRGNADRELVELRRDPATVVPDPIAPWAAERLTEEHLAMLDALPTSVTCEITGLGRVLSCHATPRDDAEAVVVDSAVSRWEAVLASVPEDVETVVCGHTHMPFVRQTHGRVVVNPGSVGMPYGRRGAHWALLGPGICLRRTVFDVDAACAEISAESGYPDAAGWAEEYVRARDDDVTALRAFGARDGRSAVACDEGE